jgi:hypothetical protein
MYPGSLVLYGKHDLLRNATCRANNIVRSICVARGLGLWKLSPWRLCLEF